MMALCLSFVDIRAAPPRGATSMNDVCNIFLSLSSFPMLHLSAYYLGTFCTSSVDITYEGSQSVFPSPPLPPSDRKFDDVLIYHAPAAARARDGGVESALLRAGKSLYGGWRAIDRGGDFSTSHTLPITSFSPPPVAGSVVRTNCIEELFLGLSRACLYIAYTILYSRCKLLCPTTVLC